MGTPCPVDVREEVNGYVHQIDSFVDHYLEKLPAHPDLGVIGGGGAMIKDFGGRHGLLIVRAGDGERNRVLATTAGMQNREAAMAEDFVVYRVHIHRRNRRSSTSCSKACRNPSGGSTSGKPWSTIVSPKGFRPKNRKAGTSRFMGLMTRTSEGQGERSVSNLPTTLSWATFLMGGTDSGGRCLRENSDRETGCGAYPGENVHRIRVGGTGRSQLQDQWAPSV